MIVPRGANDDPKKVAPLILANDHLTAKLPHGIYTTKAIDKIINADKHKAVDTDTIALLSIKIHGNTHNEPN